MSNLEEEKLKTEIAVKQAAKHKLELEGQEIKKRIDERWYSRKFIVQNLMAALIGASLILAWFFSVYKPSRATINDAAKAMESIQSEKSDLKDKLKGLKLKEIELSHKEKLKEINEHQLQLTLSLSANDKKLALIEKKRSILEIRNNELTNELKKVQEIAKGYEILLNQSSVSQNPNINQGTGTVQLNINQGTGTVQLKVDQGTNTVQFKINIKTLNTQIHEIQKKLASIESKKITYLKNKPSMSAVPKNKKIITKIQNEIKINDMIEEEELMEKEIIEIQKMQELIKNVLN